MIMVTDDVVTHTQFGIGSAHDDCFYRRNNGQTRAGNGSLWCLCHASGERMGLPMLLSVHWIKIAGGYKLYQAVRQTVGYAYCFDSGRADFQKRL